MLYVKNSTELRGAFELKEASFEDYRQLIPEEVRLELAREILSRELESRDAYTSPDLVKIFVSTRLKHEQRECFDVIFLDNQHRLISHETMFKGTVDAASVYPREVVKRALELNSCAVIFAHNHPSGVTTPSQADRRITRRLVDALNLVDIRVLDHLIVGEGQPLSFAERGFL